MKQPADVRWRILLPILASIAGLFLCLLRREQHYWDEGAYIYGAKYYTPSLLSNGVFESSNISGFYNLKIGHVFLLHTLFERLGSGLHALASIQDIYIVLTLASCVFIGATAAILTNSAYFGSATGAVALLLPVSVYLAPKYLSEVPGLFGSTLGVLFLTLLLRRTHSKLAWIYGLLCSLAATCGFLCRQNAVLIVIGFSLALIAVPPADVTRAALLKILTAIGAASLTLIGAVQLGFHLKLLNVGGVADVVSSMHMAKTEVLRRFANALGPALFFVPFALVGPRRREALLFSIWFVVGLAAVMALRLSYVEERFMVTVIPACAGLTVLGIEVLWRWFGAPKQWPALATSLVVIAGLFAVANARIQPRTVQELDTRAYQDAISWIERAYPDTPILVPWLMSDYHYLRVAYPQLPVYLASSSALYWRKSYATNDVEWVADLQEWFGERAITDFRRLAALRKAPGVLVTWELPGWSPLQFSWIRDDPRIRKTLVFRAGQYAVYELAFEPAFHL